MSAAAGIGAMRKSSQPSRAENAAVLVDALGNRPVAPMSFDARAAALAATVIELAGRIAMAIDRSRLPQRRRRLADAAADRYVAMRKTRSPTSRRQRMAESPLFAPESVTLAGKKGLVVGIANADSIAYGCARAFKFLGAELALSYYNDKAKPHVEPLATELDATIFEPLNVQVEGQLEALFEKIEERWGRLDFLLHSIAFAPRDDLHGRVTDCSRDGFLQAMDVSCHSFIRMARLAEPLMTNGGTLFTMTFFGAQKVVENYNMMGPVKAALESSVRYLAAELGPKRIRVHAISPGPLKTRAASGLAAFDELLNKAADRAPARALVGLDDVGAATAYLATDAAHLITGNTVFIDGGYNIMA
jgi:enoyl-[acyl-carrier protein] reductase I